tara:strand:+ start:258 stop:395 length:138 start_codon:yes stop_codon:yes gene_type:complete
LLINWLDADASDHLANLFRNRHGVAHKWPPKAFYLTPAIQLQAVV